MRPFPPLFPVLSALILALLSCADPAVDSTGRSPVVLQGKLVISPGHAALLDCDRHATPLKGALRDTIMQQFGGLASRPDAPRPWLTIEATDSTCAAGKVLDMQKQGPCLIDLPGTYAQEAIEDGQVAAKVHLDASGTFSLAVAPGNGSRTDITGEWSRTEQEVTLRGKDHKLMLRIVHPNALVLEDSTLFGQVLRMTRR